MVRYWKRVREPGWRYRALVNGVGATATGIVAAIVIVTKFAAGRLARDRRHPAPRARVLRYPPSLPRIARRLQRRRRRSRGGAAAAKFDPAAGRIDRRGDGRTRSGSPNGRATAYRAIHVPARGTDPGIKPRWFRFYRRAVPPRGTLTARSASRRPCSNRSGACRARRVELRHRRYTGALPAPVVARGVQASTCAAAEAPAVGRAGSRRRRRARPGRSRCGAARSELLFVFSSPASMRHRCGPSTTRARWESKTPALSISPSARKRRRNCAVSGQRTDLGFRSSSTTPPTAISAPLRAYLHDLTSRT